MRSQRRPWWRSGRSSVLTENPSRRRRKPRREPRRHDRELRSLHNIRRLLRRRSTRLRHRPRRNIRQRRRRLSILALHPRPAAPLSIRLRRPRQHRRVQRRPPHRRLRRRPQRRSRKEAGSWSAKKWRRRHGPASLPHHQRHRRELLLPNAHRARLHPIPRPPQHLAEAVPRQRPLLRRWRAVRRRPSPRRFQWSRGRPKR